MIVRHLVVSGVHWGHKGLASDPPTAVSARDAIAGGRSRGGTLSI